MADEENRQSRNQIVAEYWDEHTDDTFTGETYWLAHPSVCRRFHRKSAGGQENIQWVDYCVNRYLRQPSGKPVERILNIGCGDGELDRHLARLEAAELIDAIDIAPRRIEIARTKAEDAGFADRISYVVADAESSGFPHTDYDAIVFDSSLHHIKNLEGVLEKCARSLNSNGVLIANEYIGPNRYRFNQREREAMRAIFQLIPEKYRASLMEFDRGEIRTEMGFPDPLEVERVDPSEAIRSEDIEATIRRYFKITEFNIQGGTLLQFILHGIVGNFNESIPEDQQLLDMLFTIEDALVDAGDLSPHFALIIAEPAT